MPRRHRKFFEKEMFMMDVRNILIGLVVSALLAGIVVSCGGSSGYGGSGGTSMYTYTVGGALSGATGTVVLKLNGGSDMSMMSNGPFTFDTMIASGSTHRGQVVDASDRCTVTNGAGTMGAADITYVAVSCGTE